MTSGHSHHHHGEHGHSHGLVDPSIKRSRESLRAAGLSFVVLGLTALIQVAIVVFAIFVSACVAGIESFVSPDQP
jgi:hypothetical protein